MMSTPVIEADQERGRLAENRQTEKQKREEGPNDRTRNKTKKKKKNSGKAEKEDSRKSD